MKNLLIKSIAPFGVLAIVVACSAGNSRDEQFCRCMKAGEELDKFSSELFERAPTAEDAKKMKKLRENSSKECKRYHQMSGEEMRKRQKLCK